MTGMALIDTMLWSAGTRRLAWEHALCMVALCSLGWVAWRSWRRAATLADARLRERRMREELEAYARLDGTAGPAGDGRALAKRVCLTVVEKSVFRRAAMLLCDPEGKLYVAGSAGMDDLAVAALRAWGESAIRTEHGLGERGPETGPPRDLVGAESFLVDLDGAVLRAGRGCKRVIVTMMRGQNGTIVGALAVCADTTAKDWLMPTKDALAAIEALAVKLARTVENTNLMERLIRVEKLASLGQLAGGVAHELNNPLTAVLGFADLIAETAADQRVRQDAEMISREAQRMKQTIESLLQFWRPEIPLNQPVALGGLLRELAEDCRTALDQRQVKLVMQGIDDLPEILGNRDRLRQVLEHLMNNAAQAIANSQERRRATDTPRTELPRGADELDRSPEIRVTARQDGKTLRLIVSDTGPGFPEPGRVFDPFYTTRGPGKAVGLGLSICYGIVREHGGEISAFNLHPHGAAVVVELPVRRVLAEEEEPTPMVRGYNDLLTGSAGRARRRQDKAVAQ